MQNYRVDGGTLRLGQGAVVGLTDQQAAPRLSRMDKVSEGVYRLREVLEFKSGETIKVGLDDIPKHLRAIAVCLDAAPEAPAKPRKPAKAHA
jgi:hypothetical protein